MREARQLHIILRLEAKRVGKRTGGIAPATVEKRIGHRPHLLVQQGYSAFPVAGEIAMPHGLLRQLLQLFQQSPVVMPFASLPSPPICFQRQHTVFLQHTEERVSQSAIPDFFPAARVIVGIKLIQVFLPDHVHRRQAHGISGMPRQPVRLQQRGRSISPAGRSAALVQRRRMGTHCIRYENMRLQPLFRT